MYEFIVMVVISGMMVEIAAENFITVHLEHMGITRLQQGKEKVV